MNSVAFKKTAASTFALGNIGGSDIPESAAWRGERRPTNTFAVEPIHGCSSKPGRPSDPQDQKAAGSDKLPEYMPRRPHRRGIFVM